MRTVPRGWLVAAGSLAALLIAADLFAQAGIRRVPARHVVGIDAATLYAAYCTDCHGPAGRGDGKASAYMAVPDLSSFSSRNGDTATLRAINHLRFAGTRAEGMPKVHAILMEDSTDPARATIAEYNLARYVASLSLPPADRRHPAGSR